MDLSRVIRTINTFILYFVFIFGALLNGVVIYFLLLLLVWNKETRKKALKKENEIVNEAKAEAQRIIVRANKEAELEKSRMQDDIKKEIIVVASAMAGKIVTDSMNDAKHNELVNETLKEIGDGTWQK